jgi:hypothetical protein
LLPPISSSETSDFVLAAVCLVYVGGTLEIAQLDRARPYPGDTATGQKTGPPYVSKGDASSSVGVSDPHAKPGSRYGMVLSDPPGNSCLPLTGYPRLRAVCNWRVLCLQKPGRRLEIIVVGLGRVACTIGRSCRVRDHTLVSRCSRTNVSYISQDQLWDATRGGAAAASTLGRQPADSTRRITTGELEHPEMESQRWSGFAKGSAGF